MIIFFDQAPFNLIDRIAYRRIERVVRDLKCDFIGSVTNNFTFKLPTVGQPNSWAVASDASCHGFPSMWRVDICSRLFDKVQRARVSSRRLSFSWIDMLASLRRACGLLVSNNHLPRIHHRRPCHSLFLRQYLTSNTLHNLQFLICIDFVKHLVPECKLIT